MNYEALQWENWDGHLKDGEMQHSLNLTMPLLDIGDTGSGLLGYQYERYVIQLYV